MYKRTDKARSHYVSGNLSDIEWEYYLKCETAYADVVGSAKPKTSEVIRFAFKLAAESLRAKKAREATPGAMFK